MISHIPLLIFLGYVALNFCEGFCNNGTEIELECPCDSLVSGIQTTSDLFSADAIPLCTKMDDELLPVNARFRVFYEINSEDNRFFHFPPNKPKVDCGPGHAIQVLSICTENDGVPATSVHCSQLNSFSHSNVYYSVQGRRNSPVLKCKEGSVLSGLKYDRDHEDNVIAVASCIQHKPPSALQNCSVVQKTKNSLRISCHKDLDGGHKASFKMEVYGPDYSFLYAIFSQSADFALGGLHPRTTYNLTVYAVNVVGESPPLKMSASTLARPKRRSLRESPSALQNCSVVQKTKNSLRVSCYKDRDGDHRTSFKMEVYAPNSSLLYAISSQTAEFSLRGLSPETVYNLTVYAINAVGRSPPLKFNASTLAILKRRAGREGCKHGQLVKVSCPKGYLLTGVETSSTIFSADVHPVCTQTAGKLISENRPPKLRFNSEWIPQADCSGTHPIVWKYSMCIVDDEVRTTQTECRRFQGNVTVTAYYDIEGRPDSPVMKCPEGSYFHGLRTERNGTDLKVLGKCTAIEDMNE